MYMGHYLKLFKFLHYFLYFIMKSHISCQIFSFCFKCMLILTRALIYKGVTKAQGGIKLDPKHAKGFQNLWIVLGSLCQGIPLLTWRYRFIKPCAYLVKSSFLNINIYGYNCFLIVMTCRLPQAWGLMNDPLDMIKNHRQGPSPSIQNHASAIS